MSSAAGSLPEQPSLGRTGPYAVGHVVALFGILSALLAASMTAYALGGVSQEYFEAVRPPADYAHTLLRRAAPLRSLFALDNLFLLAYSSYFVAYFVARRGKADATVLRLVLASVLVAAGLDAIENFHILSMLHLAESGQLPSVAEIQAQYVLSAVKFLLGYFAAIGFALTFPRDTALGRLLALTTGIAFPIVGVLVFAVPDPLSGVLALARIVFFMSGYGLSAFVFWPGPTTRA